MGDGKSVDPDVSGMPRNEAVFLRFRPTGFLSLYFPGQVLYLDLLMHNVKSDENVSK